MPEYTWGKLVLTNQILSNLFLSILLIPLQTTFIMETYPVNVFQSAEESDISGYYKIQVIMEANDMTNKPRPTVICFEIKGDLEVI